MLKLPLLLLVALAAPVDAQTNTLPATATPGPTVETLVCIRHGEKPPGGLGQLTCRGLNRALALPKVLLEKYGRPQFVFAPNPAQKADTKTDPTGYYYIRPLATIEPTAIRCGLPVNTQFGFLDIQGLESELQKPAYRSSTVFIAWEHSLLDAFAKNLAQDNGGDPAQIPAWASDEYDLIFVFKLTTENGRRSLSFSVDHEGLNGLSDDCPQ